MEKQCYTAQQRRAANLVWAAAGAYGFDPMFLASHSDGTPDFYMNCVVGLVRKYYGDEIPRALFALWEEDRRQPLLDDLTWLFLESAVYANELPCRPVLSELRREHAEEFFGQEYQLSRQEWMSKNQLVYTMQAARWRSVQGRNPPVMTPYESRLAAALAPDWTPDPQELTPAVLQVFERFALFDGKVQPKAAVRLHFEGLAAKILSKTHPVQLVRTDRLTVGQSVAAEGEGKAPRQDLRGALVKLRQNGEEDRNYIESCFGRSRYPPERLARAEQQLCTGVHLGCHLWFSSGVPRPEQARTGDARRLADQAELQAERNRKFFAQNRELYQSAIGRLTGQIRNCILIHRQPDALCARTGKLDAARVWRMAVMEDDRVFLRAEEENRPAFTVDLLLDASASRLHCQEIIAAQGYILAESLRRCAIPVRVSAFCSLRGYTVVRVLKNFGQRDAGGTFRYFASGWNRDGLALRAAGDLTDFAPGPADRHLLILLTDASPNDSRRIPPGPGYPLGAAYDGPAAVNDAAAEVRALERKGIRVSAVFMGPGPAGKDAGTIYGPNLARITGMDQLAAAAGRLIQRQIRSLDD